MGNKVLIFTGMHRSGTSLIANILQKAGVDIGNTLLKPDQRNPHGFFEDVDFYEFHQQALYQAGELTPYVKPEFVFQPSPLELEKATLLIQKRADQSLWGWKDPRTCLFLDFWSQLLPQAYYIFVYRHPLEVLLSFVRRGEPHTPGLLEALTSWHVYNSKILEFCRQHRDRCLLGHTYRIVDQIDEFGKLVEGKFGLSLQFTPAFLESLYHPDELRRIPLTAEVNTLLQKLHPASIDLYQQLDVLAELPSLSPETTRQPVYPLSQLSDLITNLPEPHSPSLIRGMLFLFLSLLDIESIDTYFKQHSQYVAQLEYGGRHLELETRNKQAWIEKLEEHIRQQDQVITDQKAWIGQMEATLINIQNSYTWRFGRRLADSFAGRIARYFLRFRQQA